MSFTRLVKRALRPIVKPFVEALAFRVADVAARASSADIEFDLHVMAALRSLAAGGDHRVIPPYDSAEPQKAEKKVRIGFFGNIANNAYNLTTCLRQLGYDAELVVEDGGVDVFLLNRPFWEDMEVECDTYEEGLTREREWRQPEYVRRVAYDPQLQGRFWGRYSAVPEVQALYRDAFGVDLPTDRAVLLAQQMGHWPYLLAMKRYDVIQLSGPAISMGAFCPRPYVVFPTGGDLFISPFEETVFGLLMRTGYRNAGHLLLGDASYFGYCDRLALTAQRTFAPFMINTEVYAPGQSDDVRARWMHKVGGKRFVLNVCRQAWEWKGNDRLIHAFQELRRAQLYSDWRLVLMHWGPDVEKTRKLIAELGLEAAVLWEKLVSKPLVRKYQRAADLVVDQFVMPGYGTSVLESMAAGKAVVMRPADERGQAYFKEPPPFLGAMQPEEIRAQIEKAHDDQFREDIGQKSYKWVNAHHGYLSTCNAYIGAYMSVLSCADRMRGPKN